MPKVDSYGKTMQFRAWQGQKERYEALKEARKLAATDVAEALREAFERILSAAESGRGAPRSSSRRPPRWYARRALGSFKLTMADWAPLRMVEREDYGTTDEHREAMAAAIASFGGLPETYSALYGPSALPFMPSRSADALLLAQAGQARAAAAEQFVTAFADAIDGAGDPGAPVPWLAHPGHDPASLANRGSGEQWSAKHAAEFWAVVSAVSSAGFVGDVFDPGSPRGQRCMTWFLARVYGWTGVGSNAARDGLARRKPW